MTGVLVGTAAANPAPPQTLLVDGYTLRLVEFGAALGVGVAAAAGGEAVVFGLCAAPGGAGAAAAVAAGLLIAQRVSLTVSALTLEAVKAAAVPCEFGPGGADGGSLAMSGGLRATPAQT